MENQEERWPNWPPGSRFTLNGTAKGKEKENSDGLVARLY